MSNLNEASNSFSQCRHVVKLYVAPAVVWWLVFLFGWGTMRVFWELSYKHTYNGLETLPYYLSANWGDSLILPTVCAIGYVEIRSSWRNVSRTVACIAGLLGLIVGLLTQVQWNLNADTVKNWTFNRGGGFNLPGWYHAVFLVVMCGVLTSIIGVAVHVGHNRGDWERNSALRYMTVGYLLVLFSSLLATDNLRQVNGALPLSVPNYVGLWGKPLFVCALVAFVAHVCNLNYRGVVAYALTLATTAVSIPFLFVYRGLGPVTLIAGIGCVLAFVFGLFFITAPSSVSLVERLLRSLPTAVIAAVFMLVAMADPKKVSVTESFIGVSIGTIVLAASSVPSCLYDGHLRVALRVITASLILACLVGMQVLAVQGGQYSYSALVVLFPAVVIIFSSHWVEKNFNVVIEYEKNAVGADNSRYIEWSMRVGLLGAYIAFAAFVLITAVWFDLKNHVEQHPTSIYRAVHCAVNVVTMTVGSFLFSRLSYRNNVFVLRGVKVVPGLVYFGSVSCAVASLIYGVALFQYSSARLHVAWWAFLSLSYVGVLCIFCVATLKLFNIPKSDDDWTFTAKVFQCVLQDHLLSLSLLNILCLGLLIWISDRLSVSSVSFAVVLGIMAPMAKVFTYFIKNNVGHLGREKLRIAGILDSPQSELRDRRRGEKYLRDLEKHLRWQNMIASLMVIISANVVFLYLVVGESKGIGSAGSGGRLRDLAWF